MTAPAVQYSKDNPFAKSAGYSADNPFAPGGAFADVQGGTSTTGQPQHVGMVEGLANAAGQGATLGASDELLAGMEAFGPTGIARAIMDRKNPVDTYREDRDAVREHLRDFSTQHPFAAAGAELAGGLPTAMLAPAMAPAKAGAAFGAASAFGHGEGSATDQAVGTAEGAAGGGLLGGILGKLTNNGIVQKLSDKLLPGGAKRQAARAAATIVDPEEAAATMATRQAAGVPSEFNTIGDVSKRTAKLAQVLGKSPKAAITGVGNAADRVEAVKLARQAVGSEYDMLQQPLPIDQELRDLASAAGQPFPVSRTSPYPVRDAAGNWTKPTTAAPTETDFATVHRMRHEIGKSTEHGAGMSLGERKQLYKGFSDWLRTYVPDVEGVDARFNGLTQHLGTTQTALDRTALGADQGALREASSNSRGAHRPLSVFHGLMQAMEPTPAKAGDAMQDLLFNPATTPQSLQAIQSARDAILQGPQLGTAGRLAAAGVGQLAAPQLSNDAPNGKAAALQMRMQGMSDEQMQAQLSSQFTPAVVQFVIAATPKRVAQMGQ